MQDPILVSLTFIQIVQLVGAVLVGTSPVLVWIAKTTKRITVGEARLSALEDDIRQARKDLVAAVERWNTLATTLATDIDLVRSETRGLQTSLEVERRVLDRITALGLLKEGDHDV